MYSDAVDKSYASEFCMRQSREIARDLDSFPVGAYTDPTARCLYTDLSGAPDCLLVSDCYLLPPGSNVATSAAAAFQRQSFESYPPGTALPDARLARPPSGHCNVVTDISNGYKPAPCDGGGSWQTWRWNEDGGGFPPPSNYDANDSVLQPVSNGGGEHHHLSAWSVRSHGGGWTSNSGHGDFVTSFVAAPSDTIMHGATRRSAYWNGADCTTGIYPPCTSNYVVPYYDTSAGGCAGGAGTSSSDRAGDAVRGYCSLVAPCTAESASARGFYDALHCCRYAPAASTTTSASVVDARQLTPVSCGQSAAYQSCKYSRVTDAAHCRLYSDSAPPPPFVNTA